MAKYLIKGEKIKDQVFESESDEAAEAYVEETSSEDDGEMTLYRLTELTTWL